MTKPQFPSEPSMEDILASIRKMISEERVGPRPIPDQIGRSPFGESVSEPQVAEPDDEPLEDESDDEPPAERSTPSFSSLSDALKAATPAPATEAAPEPRLTLEEKIADMLESEDAPARPAAPSRPAAPPDPLAVFSANRSAPAASPDTAAFGVVPRSPERQDAERRMPDAASDRSSSERTAPERPSARHGLGSGEERSAELPRGPKPIPQPPEAPFNGAARPTSAGATKVAGPSPVEPTKTDTQRVIAMPARNGAAPAQQPGPAAAPTGLNGHGANVSSLGLRPFPGNVPGQRPAPSLRGVDAPGAKAPAGESAADKPAADKPAADKVVTAKSPDARKPGSNETGERVKLTDAVASVAALVEKEIKAERAEAMREGEAKAATAKAEASPAGADKPEEAHAKAAAAKTEAQPATQADKTRSRSPSDALVDAVVAMVHKEPDTLSVFTSGNAFVNGINSQAPVSKPGPNMTRKLDRSAAELLRPMLRQWLSDNMPRIVEEALRSELMSSQSPPEDSEET